MQILKNDGTFANVPPRIISSPVTTAPAESLYSYQVQAVDFDFDDPLQLDLLTPSDATWLQADQARMKLFGTPTTNDAGELAVTLMVQDKLGAQATQSFTIKVTANNRPPQITSKPDTVATEDLPYSYKIVATDPDSGDVLTLAMETDATWLKLSNDNQISGTPANEHGGNSTVTVRATDKRGEMATQKFPLRVQNVNDAPFFTTVPDTNAFVDSLHVYRAAASDVDRGDVVQILKRIAPEWLAWNANTHTLQGQPTSQQLGQVYAVTLMARDVAGAETEQTFRVRVSSLAAPDSIAPAAPQAAQIQPATWSATKKFTLQWQNPFDPSRIAGAFYKIGEPPRHARDGVFVPNPIGTTTAQFEITAPQEGKWPVYLWLMDGRSNADHRTAVRLTCRYDVTPPRPQQNLYPNRQWSRGDSVRFRWTPASDSTSGIRRYHFFLDEKFFGYIPGDSAGFLLILQLAEKNYSWTLMAEDSAGNLGAWTPASFTVDHTPPLLSHTAADTAIALAELAISTQARDELSGVREVQLNYRAAGERVYRAKIFRMTEAQPAGLSTFLTRLDAAEVVSKGLEYYLTAADSAGNRTRWPVNTHQAVVITSSNVAAPLPSLPDRYQIFSIPYHLKNASPAAVLEDDLGSVRLP